MNLSLALKAWSKLAGARRSVRQESDAQAARQLLIDLRSAYETLPKQDRAGVTEVLRSLS